MVVRDITERSLRHLQEEFLGLASHELRTPLTTISGMLQLLARGYTNQAGSERPLRQIQSARTQVALLALLAAGENLTLPVPLLPVPLSPTTAWTTWLAAQPAGMVVAHIPFPAGVRVADYAPEA